MSQKEKRTIQECKEWLKNRLSSGETVLCDIIREEAKNKGFSKSDFKQARKELNVKCWNDSNCQEDGQAMNWFWYLEV